MISRFRGDNYPITAVIKMSGVPVDLTGATVTFSYNESGTVRHITGTIVDTVNGVVKFYPSAQDFQVCGKFPFDIQRVQDGFTYTHIKGSIQLVDDVNKE